MKKIYILIFLLAIAKAGLGQAYIVTYVKGNIYHDNKPVKLHDKLDGASQVTSDDKNAELALFSLQKGKLRLTFANSKPVQAKQASQKSELYQLVVASYLQSYDAEKTLTTRGKDFDIKDFFESDDSLKTILLVEGEQLPIKTAETKYAPDDKFFICALNGKETACTLISRTKTDLIFDAQTLRSITASCGQDHQPIACLIKHGFNAGNKYSEEYFAGPVNINLLTKAELASLVAPFKEGLSTHYHGVKDKALADIEEHLAHYYGLYDERDIEPILQDLLR
jgi:hypothetical protein